jgi:hypothetical protein
MPSFGAPFQPAFATAGGKKPVAPWWLAGGIDPAISRAAYLAKGAADYAASKVNLAHPGTNDAFEGAAPVWNTGDGWVCANQQYLLTGLYPNLNWTMVIRVDAVVLDGAYHGYIIGFVGASPYATTFAIFPSLVGHRWYIEGNQYTIVSGGMSSGIFGFGGGKCYFNGIPDGTNAGSGALVDQIRIGCGPDYIATGHDGNVPAAAIYDAPLTDSQHLALATAMAAL